VTGGERRTARGIALKIVGGINIWLATTRNLARCDSNQKLFRRVNKVGRACEDGMTVKAVWHIVKECAKSIGVGAVPVILNPPPCRKRF
jgi:hypothetical protein